MILKSLTFATVISLSSLTNTSWAESMSNLLEQAIYTEETIGDLGTASKIYQQIIDHSDSQRPDIANALYRLGLCYSKLGQQNQSQQTLQRLITDFSEQNNLVTKAQQRLQTSHTAGLQLDPPPWFDGEYSLYQINSPVGTNIGASDIAMIKTIVDNKEIWRLENHLTIPLENYTRSTRLDIDSQSFYPIKETMHSTAIESYQVQYLPNKIQLTTINKGKTNSQDLSITSPTYDSEQLIPLLRRLPLTENYKTQFSILSAPTGIINEIELSVTGKQTIDVGAGSFESYEISMSVYKNEQLMATQKAWVSIDANKQLIKFKNDTITMELAKVSDLQMDPPNHFQDNKFPLSLNAPEDWRIFSVNSPDPSMSLFLQLFSPSFASSGLLAVKSFGKNAPKNLSVKMITDGDIHALKGYFKNYVIRPDSSHDFNADSLSARSFIADYQYLNKDMVEYRSYFLGQEHVYWFVFRAEKDKFNTDKAQLEKIVASFTAS